MTKSFDVIIIGAGAAGLMCALTAGKLGKRVLLLERNKKPGAKILISGGGRCNFTNLDVTPDAYISDNPHFAKSALSRYSPWDFIELIARHGLTWHEKTLGQQFCDQGAKAILKVLLDECIAAGVDLISGEETKSISKDGDTFNVKSTSGPFSAPQLVIATGGISIPKMGATDFGYRIAEQFGLEVVTPEPALVPFVFDGEDQAAMRQLAGVSADSYITLAGRKKANGFRENLLFTHRGLSGPAILQISSYWQEGDDISVDLAPSESDLESWLKTERGTRGAASTKSILSQLLPDRLADQIATDWPDKFAEQSNAALQKIAARIKAWTLSPAGTEGFKKAEVTRGGVSTHELSSKTMEAKSVAGLYFIGECVDVTGWLGGYNFQWAWASGHAAGTAVGNSEAK